MKSINFFIFPTFLTNLLIYSTTSATYTRQNCSSTQIFNSLTLSCVQCPSTNNIRPNPNQYIPTSCVCNRGFYPISLTGCSSMSTNTGNCDIYQFYNVVADNGLYQTLPGGFVCQDCASNAYVNQNGTGCIPCPRNMIYSIPQKKCICSNPSYLNTQQGCFTSPELATTNNLIATNSKYYQHLKYLLPSCAYFNDILSCSHLINLCIYSMGLGDNNHAQCQYFSQIPGYVYYLQNNPSQDRYYISPGKFTKNQQLKFKLLYFLPTGNFVKQKQMKLPDILRCGMPNDNSASVKLGNNIQVKCIFNFDYLAEKINTNTYRSYMYEMYLAGENNAYFSIDVFIGGSKIAVRRFFLEDTYTSKDYVNVLTSLKLSVFLNSTGYLNSPKLQLSYTKLTYQNNKITPTSQKNKQITYQVKFVYDLTTFWPAFLGIFITINVLVLIQAIIRTYIAYLNRQSILKFFYFFANFWSTWIFYFLIIISGYWFLFGKATQDVYIFIPDSGEDIFYVAFFIIAGVMGLFRIITILYDKFQKLNYEIFMINWEKGKNSWRQIFIVNSLAEFYTHRTISFFWMMLVLLFFMVGLKFQNHAAQVAHTTLTQIYYFNPRNRVFLYFMGATIFLVIGMVFKILRRLSVLVWPYPFQDFVDYCNVTNISFFFMKKREPEAYYIHASIPERTQVTYKQINDAIRRGLNKQRQILKQHSFHDGQRVYSLYVCKDLQQKFHTMIKKCQDQQHQKSTKHAQKNKSQQKKRPKNYVHPREQFTERKLKPYLQGVERTTGKNKTKSFLNRLFGKPEKDLRQQNMPRNKNQIYYDEHLDMVSQVFPNGNQFQEIHTIIIIFLMFLLITANVCAAILITYFIDHYMICKWISSSCRKKLETMTRVKEGFML